MNRRDFMTRAGATAIGLGLSQFPLRRAMGADAPRRRILFFTKSSGFEHSVVKRQGDQLSHAERILTELGGKHRLEITCTKDGGLFTAENLAKYDAFCFYTTGDLTQPGTDKQPPMTAEGKAAFLDAIKNGKGFIGIHTATDTFHSHGNQIDPYIAMVGGEFCGHGKQQQAKMVPADTRFPGCGELQDGFALLEEWYAFNHLASDLHVLLAQETEGMEGPQYQRPSYPATWTRLHGKGRVYYTSLGHREDVWTNPLFQTIVLGGITWALGDANADVAPNVERVTPGYAQLQAK